MFSSAMAWPGYWAAVPVFASVMVMVAQRENKLLQQAWLQWCGNVSYSLYLWHWPIWVGLHYYGFNDSWIGILVGLGLTLLLGSASYYGIEQPMRRKLAQFSVSKALLMLVSMVAVVYVGAWTVRQFDGFTGRLSPYLQIVNDSIGATNPREQECQGNTKKDAAACQYGGERLGLIVMGDSHAQSVIRATEHALPSKQEHVLDWTMAGCPPWIGLNSTDVNSRCKQHVNKFLEQQKQLPREVPILLVARYSNYIEGPTEADLQKQALVPELYAGAAPHLSRTSAFYQDMDTVMVQTTCALTKYRTVYLLKPIPEMPENVPKYLLKRHWLGLDAQVQVSKADYIQRHQRILHSMQKVQQQCGAKLLDPTSVLCSKQTCYGSDAQGRPYYYDDDHLSLYGAQQLQPIFKTMFMKQ